MGMMTQAYFNHGIPVKQLGAMAGADQRDLYHDRQASAGDADRPATADDRVDAAGGHIAKSQAEQVSTSPAGSARTRTETTRSAPPSAKMQQINNEAADEIEKTGK